MGGGLSCPYAADQSGLWGLSATKNLLAHGDDRGQCVRAAVLERTALVA